MAALLLDIGNSRIKWGVLRDGSIQESGNVEQAHALNDIAPDVDAAIACNVAGDRIADEVVAVIELQSGVQIDFVQSTAEAGGVRSAYTNPASLGVDRWVALIGARSATSNACVVVDAGTAITIDAMDGDGQHLGGQILPGLSLMARALDRDTSNLPDVSERVANIGRNDHLFADDTADAIVTGVISAATGAVAIAVQAMQARGLDPDLLLTGGDAELLQQHLSLPSELHRQLVLEGLARLAAGSSS